MKGRKSDTRRTPRRLWQKAATRMRAGMGTAAARTRSIGDAITKLRRTRSASRKRAAVKAAIIRFMRSAGGHSAAIAVTPRASIAWALHVTVDELQPLLDELVQERKIFRCEPPLPGDHYALARWRPDREKLV
jgi:hypothetical protein